jgi:sulfur carrier protein
LQILLNGEPYVTDARDLAALCATLGFAEARIATAVNGSFVAAPARAATALAPQDEIEIVAPRQGG